jgi:hypothetical protein
VLAVSLYDNCQLDHYRDIVELALVDETELASAGLTGLGPPLLARPRHSPQMKFTSLVYTLKGAAEALTLLNDRCLGVIVSCEFVQLHRLDTAKATEPVQLRLANSKSVSAMDTIARVKIRIGDHVSEDWM